MASLLMYLGSKNIYFENILREVSLQSTNSITNVENR